MDISERFLEKIKNSDALKGTNSRLITRAEYDTKVARLLELQAGQNRVPGDSNLISVYEVVKYEEVSVLRKKETEKRVICAEDIYDVIKSAHIATGHGGRDVTRKRITKKIPQYYCHPNIGCFDALSQLKRCRPKKSIVVKPF